MGKYVKFEAKNFKEKELGLILIFTKAWTSEKICYLKTIL